MADYYPLIARAVAGLDKNTGEVRRALYERARTALVTKLRGTIPPLSESDITRERLALEEAIRGVEADAARQPRDTSYPELDAMEETYASSEAESGRAARDWPSLSDQGLKGFRDVVSDADNLGDASAKARESARDVYDAIPPGRPFSSRNEDYERLEPRVELEGYRHIPADSGLAHSLDPVELSDMPPVPRAAPSSPRYDDIEDGYKGPQRSYRGLIKIVALLLVAAAAGGAYWQRDSLASLYTRIRGQPAPLTRETAATIRPKIADRVGGAQDSAARPSTAPAASVAQKVVLYEEDASDSQGKRFVGSALWRTETVSPGPGLAPELAVRTDVEIPERHMRMTLSLRRNTDKALPASHTIEIIFTLSADFSEGGIANIPGLLMKQGEQTRGVPLAGLAVKVTNNFFLIGLSAVESDVQRNAQLLKERSWFDIPVVYNNGKRAILAVEKGTPGERVFEEAFKAWGQ